MISSRNLIKTATGVLLTGMLATLPGCSSDDAPEDDADNAASGSATISTSVAPDAPQLSEQPMERFSVDQKLAKKLHNAGDEVRNQWYIDRLREANIRNPERVMLSLRGSVCSDIDKETTIAQLSSGVLSPYEFSGEQKGVVISASLMSECPKKTVMVPQGATKKEN